MYLETASTKWPLGDVINGSALYYPFIDVRDRAWLRSALLNWDDSGALVTLTDVAVKNHFARRKARKDSKYTYLLDGHGKFIASTRSSAFTVMQAAQQYQPQ
jgi:hypothetical protein